MTRLVITSDWHGDHVTLGRRRHDEVREAVAQSVEIAVAEKADAYLCLGDISDPDTGGDVFRTIAVAIQAALFLRGAGVPSIWVAGNHDVCEDGTGASTLTPLKALEDVFPTDVYVASAPRLVRLREISVLCLPFMPASHGVDVGKAAEEILRDVHGERLVVAGHLMLPGIHPGSETDDMPRGREVVFPLEQTRGAALRLNGHYHQRQMFDPGDGGSPIYVPGSLARLTFGEESYEPSILVVDV